MGADARPGDDRPEGGVAPAAERTRGFPAPVTILTVVLILVWIAAFFIPSGQYRLDESGSPIPGSFQTVPPPLDLEGRVEDLLLAPVNGMYGLKDPNTGRVGPFYKGAMFGSIEVFLFILSIGGFMSVVFSTGALDLGIHHLSYRFRERGALLIALGYDRMVTVTVVTVAPFVGAIGSTINPFMTGIGSSKAGVSIADGLGLRIVLLALTMAATVGYTL